MNKYQVKELLNKDNPIIFEIGCADGKDTLEFMNVIPNAMFFCFEPEQKNIDIVKATIKNNNHHLFEGVISDIDGEITFNRSRTDNENDLRYSGSIKKPKEHLTEWPFIKFDEQVKIKSITLDTFCQQNNINFIDFIWADVQGAEDNLIKGGLKILNKSVRFLYTEYSNKEYYENQPNLSNILKLLGNDWEIVKDFKTDILLKNKNI